MYVLSLFCHFIASGLVRQRGPQRKRFPEDNLTSYIWKVSEFKGFHQKANQQSVL